MKLSVFWAFIYIYNRQIMYSTQCKLSVFLVAVLFLFSVKSKGQAISLESLFKMHSLNQEQIEDFAMSKGYEFTNSETFGSTIISHAYDKHDLNNVYRIIILDFYKDKNLISSEFSTTSQKEYINLKNQIDNKGYTYVSTNTYGRSTKFIYKNSSLSKYTVAVIKSRNEDTGNTHYVIQVINQPLSDKTYAEIKSIDD